MRDTEARAEQYSQKALPNSNDVDVIAVAVIILATGLDCVCTLRYTDDVLRHGHKGRA